MHFFVAYRLLSIAVINKTYLCHVRNLRPMNWLIYHTRTRTHTANKIKLRQFAANVLTHDSTVV